MLIKINMKKRSNLEDLDEINVDIVVHIMVGQSIQTPCGKVSTKKTCQEMHTALARVNDIYRQAKIKFNIKTCKQVVALPVSDKVYDPKMIDKIEDLFDDLNIYDNTAVNVFVVPIIADGTNAYQVEAMESYIVSGASDPLTCQKQPSSRFATVLAHELGHELGLMHTTSGNNLMKAFTPHGETLTERQINTVRTEARRYKVSLSRRSGNLKTCRNCRGRRNAMLNILKA